MTTLPAFVMWVTFCFSVATNLTHDVRFNNQNEISGMQKELFRRFQTQTAENGSGSKTIELTRSKEKLQSFMHNKQPIDVILIKQKQHKMKRNNLVSEYRRGYIQPRYQQMDEKQSNLSTKHEQNVHHRRLIRSERPFATERSSEIRISDDDNKFIGDYLQNLATYGRPSFQTPKFEVFSSRRKRKNIKRVVSSNLTLNSSVMLKVLKRDASKHKTASIPACDIKVTNQSIQYFHSQLLLRDPNFIQFHLAFCDQYEPKTTSKIFKPLNWFWTYNTTSGPLPFLSWNLDYGILSFGLLDAKTINIDYVCIERMNTSCDVTFGEYQTSLAVTTALKSLVDIKDDNHYKYPENFFCYLSTRQNYSNTISYWAAKYFIFPVTFVYYRCCSVTLDYTALNLEAICPRNETSEKRFNTWMETRTLPYILGLLILLYFPIMFFNFGAWYSRDEKILSEDEHNLEIAAFLDDRWLFADGFSPLELFDLLSFKTLGIENFSVTASRIRRLFVVVLFPTFIYVELVMYANGIGMWNKENQITVKDLVKAGAPMGFLSVLADIKQGQHVFVPVLGGPVGVIAIYYVMSIICIVFPRSLKQIVEDGLASSNLVIRSPLFFGTDQIIEMASVNVKPHELLPGYCKASTTMRCRFYMLFTSVFWKRLWNIQTNRVTPFMSCSPVWLNCLFLPVYISFCLIEGLCCVVFNAFPFFTFVAALNVGGLKSLRHLRGQNRYLYAIFKYRISAFMGASFVSAFLILYSYVVALAFIANFIFVSKVVTYCFVAIVVYPSVSFGYLFFFIVLLYYFIKLFRDFGEGYAELLSTAIDISITLSECTRVFTNDGHVIISNLQSDSFKSIKINGKLLDVSPNILHMLEENRTPVRVRKRNNTYGIPRQLFNVLVRNHRPIHKQVLTLCIKSAMMIFFVFLILGISSNYVKGPNTDISEVMHVVFIVVVGVLPQLVEAVISRSNRGLVREIQDRDIQMSIIEFWDVPL